MISLNYADFKRTKKGGVYLSYDQIESLTEMILMDYEPQLLREPGAIDYEDFLESYLGVDLQYQHIYSASNEGDILGCAIFDEQLLKVFDKENMTTAMISCPRRSVVLDPSIVEGDRKIQATITGLHEGGHIWIHYPLLGSDPNQMSIPGVMRRRISCRRAGIENMSSANLPDEEAWREWQATIFAVTLALPAKSLDISVHESFDRHGVKSDVLITDRDFDTQILADEIIPAELSEVYGMSKTAIRIRLKKLGYFVTRERFNGAHAQMSFMD